MTTPDEKILYDLRDVMTLTSLKRSALYEALADGRLEARKMGRRTFVTRDALHRFIAALPAWEPERANTTTA